MVDNVTVDNGTGTDYGVAGDKVTYSGDADQTVQLVRVVGVTGAEGSKTVDALNDANGLKVSGSEGFTLQQDSVNAALLTASLGAVLSADGGTVRTSLDAFGSSEAGVAVGGMVYNGTTWDRLRGSTNGLWAQGNVAHDAADSGNPVKIGGKYTAGPTPVADGDRVDARFNSTGSLAVFASNGMDINVGAGTSWDSGDDLADATTASGAGATAPVVYNGSTWDRLRGNTAGLFAQGNVAHDAADSGNPVKIGGVATSAGFWPPTAVTNGDRVQGLFSIHGAQAVTLVDYSTGNAIASLGAVGVVAHDVADSGNPIKIGGKASSSVPATVANGDRVDAAFDTFGRQIIAGSAGHSGADSVASMVSLPTFSDSGGTVRPLSTMNYVFNGSNYDRARTASADALAATGLTAAGLMGYNGSTWDRLRSDTTNGLDVDVTRMAPLVAGTANIGDVDVLTVPAPLSTTGGGTEATALRVTLATDSTGLVSVDDNGGSLTIDGTVAVSNFPGSSPTAGDVAHDAADSGNPVKIGGVASSAAPTSVTAGDRVQAWYQPDGRAVVTIAGTGGVAGTTSPADDVAGAIGANVWSENAVYDGTNWDRMRGDATGGVWVQGNLAHDAVDAGNPVKIGGKASAATPSAVSGDGDRVDSWWTTRGALNVRTVDGNGASIVGAAATLADGTSNPTISLIGATNHVFNGTTWDRMRGDTSGLFAQGNIAHDAVDAGNPLKIGGKANDSAPTQVANADRVDAWLDRRGAVFTRLTDSAGDAIASGVQYVEDSAITANAGQGTLVVARRDDALSTLTPAEGDAIGMRVSARGALWTSPDLGPYPAAWFAGADITTATTTNIKTPTSGSKLVVTKVTLGTGGTTAGLVTVWLAASGDTTVNLNTDDVLFRGVLTPTANATPGVILDFPVNAPVGTTDYLLKVTTAATTTLYVTARGYEVI